MRKFFLLITLVIFILFSNTNLYSQIFRDITKVGTTAGQFLKIGPGARALGMGGTYIIIQRDSLLARGMVKLHLVIHNGWQI